MAYTTMLCCDHLVQERKIVDVIGFVLESIRLVLR